KHPARRGVVTSPAGGFRARRRGAQSGHNDWACFVGSGAYGGPSGSQPAGRAGRLAAGLSQQSPIAGESRHSPRTLQSGAYGRERLGETGGEGSTPNRGRAVSGYADRPLLHDRDTWIERLQPLLLSPPAPSALLEFVFPHVAQVADLRQRGAEVIDI